MLYAFVTIYIFFHLVSVRFVTVYTFLFTKLSFRDDRIGIYIQLYRLLVAYIEVTIVVVIT